MELWKSYRLGDICTVFGRIGFRGYTTEDLTNNPAEGAISLSPTNIVGGELDLSKPTYIKWDKYEESPEIMIRPNDVVIVKTGSSVGRTALVREVVHPMTLNPQLVVLKDIKVNPTFLSYLVKTARFQGLLKSITVGSAIPTLSQKNLANLSVDIPDERVQERIAHVLNSIDAKILLNNRINHNLESQAQALYKAWFVDFKPFRSKGFVDSELGLIPIGWNVKPLDSFCSIISRGFSPKYNETSSNLVLGQRCVRNNLIDISLARRHDPKSLGERELRKWDILINSTGMGSLGRVAQIYFSPDKLTYDSHLTLVRAKDGFSPQYIGRNLLARQDEIENMAVGSTGQTELPRERVRAMPILCPPESIMNEFGHLVEPLANLIQINLEANASLCKDRDELLPRLMSGVFYHRY